MCSSVFGCDYFFLVCRGVSTSFWVLGVSVCVYAALVCLSMLVCVWVFVHELVYQVVCLNFLGM